MLEIDEFIGIPREELEEKLDEVSDDKLKMIKAMLKVRMGIFRSRFDAITDDDGRIDLPENEIIAEFEKFSAMELVLETARMVLEDRPVIKTVLKKETALDIIFERYQVGTEIAYLLKELSIEELIELKGEFPTRVSEAKDDDEKAKWLGLEELFKVTLKTKMEEVKAHKKPGLRKEGKQY